MIAETSTLNCSANSATTASAGDSGSFTATSHGNDGSDSARAHTCLTSPAIRPSPGEVFIDPRFGVTTPP